MSRHNTALLRNTFRHWQQAGPNSRQHSFFPLSWGQVFRSRIGSMRKALKGRAEFFFMDAPYTLEPEAVDDRAVAESGGAAGAVGRSWW